MTAALLEHLQQPDPLLEAEVLRKAEREAQCRILLAAVDWARLNDAAHFDPASSGDGSEQLIRIGGEGTPLIGEFAPAALAGRLGYSPHTARMLMADALDLAHRLPRIWRRVRDLEAIPSYARLVARKTRDLTAEQAGYVDHQVVRYVDGRVGWTKLETLVEAAVIRADRESAKAREEAAAKERFVKTTRAWQGMQGLYVRADVAAITMVMARINHFAQVLADLGDPRDVDARRVTALLFLANPAEALKLLARHRDRQRRDAKPPAEEAEPVIDEGKLLPGVWMFVHVLTGTLADDTSVARIEGVGPVTTDWVRTHLGEQVKFRITPVLDPLGQAPVAAYEIPERHREGVRILTPSDIYPFAGSASRSQQIDHTQEWCPTCSRAAAEGTESSCACGGYSGIGNYGPMKPFHHRIKTHAGGDVDVKQPFPGIYVWRDSAGQFYLVDNTGTRKLGHAPRSRRVDTIFRLLTYERAA